MSKASGLFIFALGAATGSVLTLMYLKKREDSAHESHVEEWSKIKDEMKRKKEAVWRKEAANPKVKEESAEKPKSEEEQPVDKTAVRISEEDFESEDDYGRAVLTIYTDGIIADDFGDEADGYGAYADMLTDEIADYFDSCTESIYMRDDARGMCYEIMKSDNTWVDEYGSEEA